MFSRDEMQRAIEDALKTMEGVGLELYRRGREEAREELETVKRERDEWRDKFHALNQTTGELCDACGWAFKIPGEPCRCEVVRERDEARREADRLRHGCTVEGDFVCPNEYEVGELTAERNFLRALKKNHEEDFARVCKERDEARADLREFVRQTEDAYALLKPLEDGSDVVERAVGHLLTVLRGRERPGPWAFDAVLRERDEARAEVERLREALEASGGAMSCTHEWRIDYVPVDECQKCHARKEEVEAFRRGAEAMREACARWMSEREGIAQWVYDDALSALPIPEET